MADLPALAAADFAAFFDGVHRTRPFPWQARLSARLAAGGSWPQVLDLPTGSGKTAAIDVAIFQLALEAGSADRSASLRVVYVVDRRTIVDQAYERALRILRAIKESAHPVLVAVRARLASYGRDALPLQVALLRGGIARSDLWARSPDQPLIAVSTVDQVGSRLLFRGYGVSDVMKPIHAGLLGNDVLYLLDEVHLSEPFRETLAAVGDRYEEWAERRPGRPIAVVEMSATPGRASADRFSLDADDEADPVLSRRLRASKPTALAEVAARAFAGEVETRVVPLAKQGGATIAVVVNRVAAARELYERLSARLAEAEVRLLTGRMRPLDRDALEAGLFERLRAGRRRDPTQPPVVVVATQCIEAGADFDFDALVTECASLDALRQRFGRLDRLGELDGGARGVVIGQSHTFDDDPVYGPALGATWRWLNQRADDLDFGIGRLGADGAAADGLLAPRPHAPILLPSHLDAWVQTSPRPVPDPDVALWLHGPARGAADVQVVWRADLSEEVLRRACDDGDPRCQDARGVAVGIVEAIPPASGEAMSVPFTAVRRWLDGRPEPEIADVEGARESESDDESWEPRPGLPRPALAWRGDASEVIAADGLRPGDTVVVPSTYGGVAGGSWSPQQTQEAVADLAELAVLRQRGRAQLRLHPQVVAAVLGGAAPAPPIPAPIDSEDLDDSAAVGDWLAAVSIDSLDGDAAALMRFLAGESRGRGVRVERLSVDIDGGECFLVSARRRVSFDGEEVTTEDDRSSFTGVAVPLATHLGGVGDTAGEFSRRLGMEADLTADVRLAGRWHDVGKVDPRFQRLLHGGSEFKALVAKQPLAKSALPINDRRSRQLAQQRSGYPRGTRHELMSLALMASAGSELATLAHDWELVQHLVASHHGRCRPLAPWVADPDPVEMRWTFDGIAVAGSSAHQLARLDSGVAERFWRLVRRYGWWGLAWLETLVRLGDHRRSEDEQQSAAGGER